MNIALDVMGGDHAPSELLLGALEAAPLLDRKLILVGDLALIEPMLPRSKPPNIELHHASQAVGMEEKPLDAYRKKKDSSIMVCANLVKEGCAGAYVSAGNTGAASATSLLVWRQVPGIHRPAIASAMPNRHGGYLLLDSGASPDVDPEHLLEFALMGRSYAQSVMGRPDPTVHLLNIGEEEGKGNAFAKQAYKLLAGHPWFRGNIEGKDLYLQPCDVVVCDAFVGNIVLKTSEGVADLIVSMIREQIPTHPIARLPYLPMRGVMAPIRKMLDWREVGGSPLLGVNGICIICHGRSDAKAIKNAILVAQKAIANQLVEAIRRSVEEEKGGIA